MEQEIFKKAVKLNLTFATSRGVQLPQQIYQLPLTGNNGFNLDMISKDVLKSVRKVDEESLVTDSKIDPLDQLRLDILKVIIADKKAEIKANEERSEKAAKLQKLLAIKAKRQEDKIEEISDEELEAELAALKE